MLRPLFRPLVCMALFTWVAFAESNTTQILFLGDSLTAGYGVKRDEAFPFVVEKKLREKGVAVQVINGAESGSLSASTAGRLKWYLKRIHPKIIVLTSGGNDARQARPTVEIEKDLRATLKLASDNHVKVVLGGMRIFPNLGGKYSQEFQSIYNHLKAEFKDVALIPFVLDGVAGKLEMNQADGFHPNPNGHQKIAATLLPAIEKMIK